MSYPRNPKSARIDAMLLDWAPVKVIEAETRATSQLINSRASVLGLKFYRITEEERRFIASRRKGTAP